MHLCDNRKCVRHDHLRPGTYAENSADMVAKGRSRSCHDNVLSDDAVREIRRLVSEGEKLVVVGMKFGVSESMISRIANRKRWKHVA
jgi:hypothetical protein